MDVVNENSSITLELEKLFETDDSPIEAMEKIADVEVKVEANGSVESNLSDVKPSIENCEVIGAKAQKISRRNKNKSFATRAAPIKDSDQPKKNSDEPKVSDRSNRRSDQPKKDSDQPKKDSDQPKVSDRSNRRSDRQKSALKLPNSKTVGRAKLPNFSCTDLKLKDPIQPGELLFRSPDFPLPEYSSGAHIELEYSSKYVVHMSIIFHKKKQRGQLLNSKLKPRVDFVLIARNRRSQATTKIVRSVTCKFGELFVYDDAYWNSINVTNLKWFYALEEAITFQVHVERLRVAGKWLSNNGILVWSLDKYLENEELQLKGAIEGVHGPYFYTAPRGYRVQINAWIHRKEGNERGVWFEVNFLSGKYDQELSKSFFHRTSITLARNYEPSDNLVRSVEKDLADQPRYFIFVGSNTQVAGYVVDNALNYKVVIEALPVGERNESKSKAENVEDEEKICVLEKEDAVINGKGSGNKNKNRRVEFKKMRKEELRARKADKIAKKREGKAMKALVKNGAGVPVLKVLTNDANGEISKSENDIRGKEKPVAIVGSEETDENDIFKIEADLNESSGEKMKSVVFRERKRNVKAGIRPQSEENDIFKIHTKIFEENFKEASYEKKKKSGAFQKKRRTGRNFGGRKSKFDETYENDIFKIGTDLNDENCPEENRKLMVETKVMTMEKTN